MLIGFVSLICILHHVVRSYQNNFLYSSTRFYRHKIKKSVENSANQGVCKIEHNPDGPCHLHYTYLCNFNDISWPTIMLVFAFDIWNQVQPHLQFNKTIFGFFISAAIKHFWEPKGSWWDFRLWSFLHAKKLNKMKIKLYLSSFSVGLFYICGLANSQDILSFFI